MMRMKRKDEEQQGPGNSYETEDVFEEVVTGHASKDRLLVKGADR